MEPNGAAQVDASSAYSRCFAATQALDAPGLKRNPIETISKRRSQSARDRRRRTVAADPSSCWRARTGRSSPVLRSRLASSIWRRGRVDRAGSRARPSVRDACSPVRTSSRMPDGCGARRCRCLVAGRTESPIKTESHGGSPHRARCPPFSPTPPELRPRGLRRIATASFESEGGRGSSCWEDYEPPTPRRKDYAELIGYWTLSGDSYHITLRPRR